MFKFIVLTLLLMMPFDSTGRTVILGFDGMDPKLVQQWMDSGDLPHFKDLAKNGHFQSLATTNPAQSPVAWASFATGLNPGKHGIFDFIHRDPEKLEPVYSISGFKQTETFDFFGWQVPTSEPVIYNKRLGKPFWLTAEQAGNNSSILRVPVTYPPDNVSSMLSGMGVPDLLGTQGTYAFYATKFISKGKAGGNIVRIKVKNDRIETKLDGPPNPFGGGVLSIPLILNKVDHKSLTVNINGEIVELQQGGWSQWLAVKFSYGGIFSLNGMVRMHLVESFPRVKLYMSPININPQSPVLPIANPPEFAKQLSDELGLYHTLGMPEETWSLNDGLIDSRTYLQMVKTVLAEREKMFFRQLADETIELLVAVFVQTDRISHMFWRAYDSQHPGYANTTEIERSAIKWIYTEADRILGETLSKLQSGDKLMVISDHGFAPYYRHVNLNRWLLQQGYLTLHSNIDQEKFTLKDVDWQKTSAYAMGLNGIYLNLKGREKFGSIATDEVQQLGNEIIAKLNLLYDTEKQKPVINHIYKRDNIYYGEQSVNSPDLIIGYKRGYRASWQTVLGEAPQELFSTNTDKWSGDHCIDPQLVPGVLFTNFKLNQNSLNKIKVTNIVDIGTLALSTLSQTKINIEENLGVLDATRSFVTSILSPLNKYLSPVVAAIIAGFVLILWLKFLMLISSKVTRKFVIRLLIRSILLSVSLIIYIDAAKGLFSKDNISPTDGIIIKAMAINTVKLPQLTWVTADNTGQNIEIQSIGKNIWQYQLTDSKILLQESDGYQLIDLSITSPAYSKVQKRWWHNILSNRGGYISPQSQVKKITVESVKNNDLWWLWLFVGMFLPIFFLKVLR